MRHHLEQGTRLDSTSVHANPVASLSSEGPSQRAPMGGLPPTNVGRWGLKVRANPTRKCEPGWSATIAKAGLVVRQARVLG